MPLNETSPWKFSACVTVGGPELGWYGTAYTSGQSSNPRRHSTCGASSQWSHTVSSTPCHGAWTSASLSAHPPIYANARRLKSRHPFVPVAQPVISSSGNKIRAAQWADNPTRLCIFIPDTGTSPPEWHSHEEPGSGLTASAPVSDDSAPACTNGVWPPQRPECGTEQTVDQVVLQCPIHRPPHRLTVLDDETTECLLNICPEN